MPPLPAAPTCTLLLTLLTAAVYSGASMTMGHDGVAENLLRHLVSINKSREAGPRPNNTPSVVGYLRQAFELIAQEDITGGSVVYDHEFITTSGVTSVNLVLEMRGVRWGRGTDRLAVLGAHHDVIPGIPGINDNGSGMAVLLEVARYVAATRTCHRYNTLLFVAFDAEEAKLQGSRSFVEDHFIPSILQQNHIPPETFHGAYILDTVMNYDNTPHSQTLPEGLDMLFSEEVKLIAENEYRGNFLAAVGRARDGGQLELLARHWHNVSSWRSPRGGAGSSSPHLLLPLQIPDYLLGHKYRLGDLFRSDHFNFWSHDGPYSPTGLKALFLTDSANFRGYMRQCYHQACDDLSHVTPARLHFLSQTTQSLQGLLLEVSAENTYCHLEVRVDYVLSSSYTIYKVPLTLYIIGAILSCYIYLEEKL